MHQVKQAASSEPWNCSLSCWNNSRSWSQNLSRKTSLSAVTDKKKRGKESIHLGAIQSEAAGGNDVVDVRMMFEVIWGHVWSTPRKPMSAPRCLGSRASSSSEAALVRKSRS